MLALEAKTGKLLWEFDPKVPGAHAGRGCCDVANRGVAVWGGKVFVGTYDGRLIALDAKSGHKVWEELTVDPAHDYTITGAPRVVKGKVIIGNGGAEFGVRGYVTAYDAETGKQAWRFYTVPGDPQKGFETKTVEMIAQDLERRVVETGRRRHGVGLDGLRSGARPALHRRRQRLVLELEAALGEQGRQPVPRLDRGDPAGQRRIRLALPDHAGRRLGLYGDPAHDPRRPDRSTARRARSSCRRRRTASSTCSTAAPASSSPARPMWQTTWATRPRREGPPDRQSGSALRHHRQAGAGHARPARRPQLAADELQPAHRARLHPGRSRPRSRIRRSTRRPIRGAPAGSGTSGSIRSSPRSRTTRRSARRSAPPARDG